MARHPLHTRSPRPFAADMSYDVALRDSTTLPCSLRPSPVLARTLRTSERFTGAAPPAIEISQISLLLS